MKPYIPDELPLAELDTKRLIPYVGTANAALARYDGLLQGIPNPAVMLSPLTTQEAVLSSRIEGTQATMDEVFEQEAGLVKDGEKYKDIQEIINYRKALSNATNHLREYPIRLSFVCQLHKDLMDSVRGQNKKPGQFRTDQNWIGRPGAPIEEAIFIPPTPLLLNEHLEKWEAYLEYSEIDVLIHTAVMHAQFELLHPFNDGNGRIGRILIPLFLYQKKHLSEPMFYLSEYLENNRAEYYMRLQAISAEGDWNGWIAFFLNAVSKQAKQNGTRVLAIKELYDAMKQKIADLTRSQFAVHLLDAIFSSPIFSMSDLTTRLEQEQGIHNKTASAHLRQLRDEKILLELRQGRGRRPAILCFPQLLNLVEGRRIF